MIELGGGSSPANSAANEDIIKDGSDATFMKDVIEASKGGAVVVQFTAPWCGPCKTLGPMLETAVRKHGGKVKLVRINIDENQMVAGQLRVQSVPTIFGFANGNPVDAFQGAVPQSEIDKFVTQLASDAGPSPEEMQLDAILDAADTALEEGAGGDAAQAFAQVLSIEPENLRAIAGFAKCYVANGDPERAKEILATAPADKADDPLIQQVHSQIALAEVAGESGDSARLRAALDGNPGDNQARYDLAMALIGGGDNEGGITELLELFRRDNEWNEDAARQQLFKVFEALGPTHPLTLSGRRKLSSLVFA